MTNINHRLPLQIDTYLYTSFTEPEAQLWIAQCCVTQKVWNFYNSFASFYDRRSRTFKILLQYKSLNCSFKSVMLTILPFDQMKFRTQKPIVLTTIGSNKDMKMFHSSICSQCYLKSVQIHKSKVKFIHTFSCPVFNQSINCIWTKPHIQIF